MTLRPGVRVVRGPHWCWGNQDGGDGFVGTVCEIGRPGCGSPDKTVVVQWDYGFRTNYRIGYQGKYDLRVIDNAQVGIKHANIICDGCQKHSIAGMRFRCQQCNDYDLCAICYHSDKHDLSHPFQRFDEAESPGVDLPLRRESARCQLFGIFVGAKVTRGHDWEWGDQDGGDGKTGRVMDIRGWDNESARSVANVTWTCGTTNVYRLGHKGNCDLKCVQPSGGGFYYRDHVPVLRDQESSSQILQNHKTSSSFSVGDKVLVNVGVDTLKELQQGHGGWNQRMVAYIGKIGTVHRVTVRGDIRVQHEGSEARWTYNPSALAKINSFAVGDIICLINDCKKVKELQKGHGEWIDSMKNILGKMGKILKVYPDGDVRVQLDGMAWTLNPACVRHVPGSATELSNTMHADQNQRDEPSVPWHPAFNDTSDTSSGFDCELADKLIKDAAHGKLESVTRILIELRQTIASGSDRVANIADLRSNGRTALQVAAHQGHVAIVVLLLDSGANLNLADEDGDTALHYAAFGNQPEVLTVLLQRGAAVNAVNKGKCTALHIAAHKTPATCVSLLIANGADLNVQDLYGDTALHDAIGKESNSITEILCNTPGMDFTLCNKRGFNVLHHAALKGNNFAARVLLTKARQLVDVKKDDGFSALHLAALNGHRDVVDTLIRLGHAHIDQRNNRNQTALLLAVSQGHCGVIELLANLSANINVQDEDGDTALHVIILKRANINGDVDMNVAGQIFKIYNDIGDSILEHRKAIAIACYLVKVGCSYATANSRNQLALVMLQDERVADVIRSYKIDPNVFYRHENADTSGSCGIPNPAAIDSVAIPPIDPSPIPSTSIVNQCQSEVSPLAMLRLQDDASSELSRLRSGRADFNLTVAESTLGHGHVTGSPVKKSSHSRASSRSRSSSRIGRSRSNSCHAAETETSDATTSSNGEYLTSSPRRGNSCGGVGDETTGTGVSPMHKIPFNTSQLADERISSPRPVACSICMELSEENVTLEPCGHKPVCEECVARVKVCFLCSQLVQRRVTKDGRVIPLHLKLPSAERVRYLECKMAEIEEMHGCSICMERRKNVVFLCGHGTCSKCADTLKICHMCRKTITKKIPMY